MSRWVWSAGPGVTMSIMVSVAVSVGLTGPTGSIVFYTGCVSAGGNYRWSSLVLGSAGVTMSPVRDAAGWATGG